MRSWEPRAIAPPSVFAPRCSAASPPAAPFCGASPSSISMRPGWSPSASIRRDSSSSPRGGRPIACGPWRRACAPRRWRPCWARSMTSTPPPPAACSWPPRRAASPASSSTRRVGRRRKASPPPAGASPPSPPSPLGCFLHFSPLPLFPVVTSAKAGVQGKRPATRPWIPACAGMTAEEQTRSPLDMGSFLHFREPLQGRPVGRPWLGRRQAIGRPVGHPYSRMRFPLDMGCFLHFCPDPRRAGANGSILPAGRWSSCAVAGAAPAAG